MTLWSKHCCYLCFTGESIEVNVIKKQNKMKKKNQTKSNSQGSYSVEIQS